MLFGVITPLTTEAGEPEGTVGDSSIRPSVDGLYRDGTVHISREMHKLVFPV